jgi:hypothetical protein
LMLNRSRVAVAPDRRRIAQAFMTTCRIHVVTPDKGIERQIAGPVDVNVQYEVYLDRADGQEKMAPHPQTKLCYTQVTATRRGIIALFAGNAFSEFKERMSFGEQLHEMSWDGRPLAIWQLDAIVQNIAASPDGQRLWAITSDQNRLVEYQFPTAFKQERQAIHAVPTSGSDVEPEQREVRERQ